jgi:hypothetical protein
MLGRHVPQAKATAEPGAPAVSLREGDPSSRTRKDAPESLSLRGSQAVVPAAELADEAQNRQNEGVVNLEGELHAEETPVPITEAFLILRQGFVPR